MNNDQRFWLAVWAIVGATIVAFAGIMELGYNARFHEAVSSGLVEGPIPGQPGTHWVKP